jgi:methyl-accepting chemotaxis protein
MKPIQSPQGSLSIKGKALVANILFIVGFGAYATWEFMRDMDHSTPQSVRNRLLLVCGLIAVVASVFNFFFIGRISNVIYRIMVKLQRAAAATVRTSSNLSAASQSVAESSNEQASAVQQTVASMAEMRSIISQTAKYVDECQTLSSGVREKTQDGDRIMQSMVSSMEAIQQTNSQLQNMVNIISEISNKTKVINDIVFKTQLLSFNASIEAARAGQHGRGFAVVAEEVGNLAQMSGKAAKEIEVLLQDSQKQVGNIIESVHHRISEGQSVSSQALSRFSEIASDIHSISEKIKNISNATKEQESGVTQTAKAMDQMDTTTQRNNSAAIQASNYAREIESQGSVLDEIMHESQLLILGHIDEVEMAHIDESLSSPSELEPLSFGDSEDENFELTNDSEDKQVSRESGNLSILSSAADRIMRKAKAGHLSSVKKAAGDDVTADDDSFKKE